MTETPEDSSTKKRSCEQVFGAEIAASLRPVHVIGVQMCIDHGRGLQTIFLGQTDVQFVVIDGVAHGILSSTDSTENVGAATAGC